MDEFNRGRERHESLESGNDRSSTPDDDDFDVFSFVQEKIFILLRGISDYLEKSDLEPLERALGK